MAHIATIGKEQEPEKESKKIVTMILQHNLQVSKDIIEDAVERCKKATDNIFKAGITPTDDFVKQFTDRQSFIDWVQKEAEKGCGQYDPIPVRQMRYKYYHDQYDGIAEDVAFIAKVLKSPLYVDKLEIDIPYIDKEASIKKAIKDCTIYLDPDKIGKYTDALRTIKNAVEGLRALEKADNIGSAIDGSILVERNNSFGGFFHPTIKDILEASANDETLEEFAKTVYGHHCTIDPKTQEQDGKKS